MKWDLLITKVQNGYIVSWQEDVDEGVTRNQHAVFEEPETRTGELEVMKNLLWFVMEHFGVMYSKHNAQNLNIEIQDNTQEN